MESASSPSSSYSDGPFSGLCICVTGFSKEAREQIMEATEKLGGEYSPNLHSACTHLLVKISSNFDLMRRFWVSDLGFKRLLIIFSPFLLICVYSQAHRYLTHVHRSGGHKLEHAFKYRCRAGLFIVTFQWFIDCATRNVRLRESLYSIQALTKTSDKIAESCDTLGFSHPLKPVEMIEECFQSSAAFRESMAPCMLGQKVFIDSNVSAELQIKVKEAANQMGAIIMDQWLVGFGASYVVCEGSSILRYLGHVDNIVTPVWVLKTAKQRCTQRFVRFSADLAREVGTLLDDLQDGSIAEQEKVTEKCSQEVILSNMSKADVEQRQQTVQKAKVSIRNRRNHGRQVSLHAMLPSTLLDSICWSISESPSTATIYSDASVPENLESRASGFHDSKDDEKPLDTAFSNLSRPLNESEKNELVFRHHFITILFPVDRFSEMGPSSRTFYSEKGFTCLQVLDLVYAFYQENMSNNEIEAAIHTDSRHADRLRALYSDKTTAEVGRLVYKRIEFMGSRRFLEMLKRISGDNSGNVYELVIRA
ncbi:hypothetical protein V2J09_014564 [Rumex salicifolius]